MDQDVIRKIIAAKAAQEELDAAREQAQQEAYEREEKQEARLRWAKSEILIALQQSNPFDWTPYDLWKVSDMEAMLWLREFDAQHR